MGTSCMNACKLYNRDSFLPEMKLKTDNAVGCREEQITIVHLLERNFIQKV